VVTAVAEKSILTLLSYTMILLDQHDHTITPKPKQQNREQSAIMQQHNTFEEKKWRVFMSIMSIMMTAFASEPSPPLLYFARKILVLILESV
jgi:hypothetical protein